MKLPSERWAELASEAARVAPMRELFAHDPERAAKHTLSAAGLVLDASKNRIDDALLDALVQLARDADVEARRDAMYAGEHVNGSEGRAALHVALRAPRDAVIRADGVDVVKSVHEILDRIERFSDDVRSGRWTGHRGDAITDVVHIGIGGSDLGPRFVCAALRGFRHPRLAVHFVANVDAHAIDDVLEGLAPATTLFVIASKTFTTAETMMNAHTARAWSLAGGVPESDLHRHFVAVSTNVDAARKFGIDPKSVFAFWDWVGGRYSLWSAIGLPIALSIGMDRFRELLDGAHAMDEHFATAPLADSLPVRLALIGLLNANLLGARTVCIAPYHQRLELLPAHLQQVEMESNGKSVTIDGIAVRQPTVPVIWGQPGTNAQHAYFQCLHQGTEWAPVDFIAVLEPSHSHPEHQRALLANCFAQSEALMRGKTRAEARAELIAAGTGRSRSRSPRAPQDLPRQSPVEHDRDAASRPGIARRADRALRAQGLRPGRDLGHQFVRSMGRRAWQGAGEIDR